MPLACLYSEEKDIGLTVASSFEGLIDPFLLSLAPDGLTISRTILTVPAGQTRGVTCFLAAHAGCWRPSLGWARERFPRHFYLPDPGLRETQGCFVYSRTAGPDLVRRWRDDGVRQLEIHMMYSHLGKYVPLEEPWLQMIDDRWSAVKRTTDPAAPREDAPYQEIKDYMHSVNPPKTTREAVRSFIARAHARGVRCFNYFQPTEAWEFFVDDACPEAVLHEPDGSPKLTWYDHVQLNCLPETRWGQYLVDQLEGVLAMYPTLDGIFMDQAADDDESYRVKRMTDILAGIVESRGKWCWWNGPYMVELVEHAIGMLAEGGSIQGEMLKYLSIGDKGACGLGTLERQYQRNLVNGLWPSAPSMTKAGPFTMSDADATDVPVEKELSTLHRSYMPLFELFRGKIWVLEPRPVELPPGLQGNLYRLPGGDLLAAVIDPSQSTYRPAFRTEVQVRLRCRGIAPVKAVYALSPDFGGRFALPFKKKGTVLQTTLPRLRSAVLLHLATGGVHTSVMGGWHWRAGQAGAPRLRIDNWDSGVRSVDVTAGKKTTRVRVAPGSSREVRLPAPRVARGSAAARLGWAVTIDGRRERASCSWFVDGNIGLLFEGYLAVLAGTPGAAMLTVINNTTRAVALALAAAQGEVMVADLPAAVSLRPGERRRIPLRLEADTPGEKRLEIVAREGGGEAGRVVETVQSWASVLGAHGLVPAFSGYVQLTGWLPEGSNHGSEWGMTTSAPLPPVPVRRAFLNGMPIGRVNTRNYRAWHPLYTIGVPPEVIPFLSKESELTIEPAGAEDFFKVKDVRMYLALADGQLLETPTVRDVYSSRQHELAEGRIGSPLRIPLVLP
jgi:hypothetical protein